jgi:hypothetical protein
MGSLGQELITTLLRAVALPLLFAPLAQGASSRVEPPVTFKAKKK